MSININFALQVETKEKQHGGAILPIQNIVRCHYQYHLDKILHTRISIKYQPVNCLQRNMAEAFNFQTCQPNH